MASVGKGGEAVPQGWSWLSDEIPALEVGDVVEVADGLRVLIRRGTLDCGMTRLAAEFPKVMMLGIARTGALVL
jgi:hypothetical protein